MADDLTHDIEIGVESIYPFLDAILDYRKQCLLSVVSRGPEWQDDLIKFDAATEMIDHAILNLLPKQSQRQFVTKKLIRIMENTAKSASFNKEVKDG